QIASVEFAGKCMTLSAPDSAEIPFGLHNCVQNEPSQEFVYDAMTQQIRLTSDPATCVAVGQTSRAAGPFMSRDLTIAQCDGTEPVYLEWVIRD
ncbi:hypothetical protein, partial [Tabrizicola sp.]|uniref:hypothetical protein n=1 Tax=Tabrizicola sp. TaxID=2005166 RepID=UPI003F30EAEF